MNRRERLLWQQDNYDRIVAAAGIDPGPFDSRSYSPLPMTPIPPSPDSAVNEAVEDWVLNVYEVAVEIITGVIAELELNPEQADHNARACLARLAHAQPPMTVEQVGS